MEFHLFDKSEVKKVIDELEGLYGVRLDLDYLFFINTKRKISLLSKSYREIADAKLRINKSGLYFATQEVDGLRLSVEGAQLVNPKKNYAEVSREQLRDWLKGFPVEVTAVVQGYVILKYGNDVVGCGKYKNGTILNAIGKDRRIKDLTEL
ncbi:hypothetical protein HY501_01130 [Candidatus Woesearchaeota archaeon]|nr:hypothetical protein [Candidatus Woesearchaeota archaeon]